MQGEEGENEQEVAQGPLVVKPFRSQLLSNRRPSQPQR